MENHGGFRGNDDVVFVTYDKQRDTTVFKVCSLD